jgi:hypothetical protein
MRQAFVALQRLGSAASAEAKMECVADACSLLTSALRYGTRAGFRAGWPVGSVAATPKALDAVGADELLPALMWLLLYSARVCDACNDADAGVAGAEPLPIEWVPAPSPLLLVAHCAFIERFRDPSQMFGRAAYCITHLRSSLQFLISMGLQSGPAPPVLVLLTASEEAGVLLCRGCLKRWSLATSPSECERCGAELPVAEASAAAHSAITDYLPPPLLEALPLSTRGAVV